MESIKECGIDLFAGELPSLDEIKQFAELVHSSENNRLAFTEQLDENLGKRSKNPLAAGIGLFVIGRNSEAVKTLSKAKDGLEKFLYLAPALRRMAQFDKAIKAFDKCPGYGADKLAITLEKVETYRTASNFEAADKELKACTNFKDISAEYHFQLARLQEAQGQYDQAIDNYKAALELEPNNQKTLFYLAYRYDLSGDEEAAIDCYKQIASSNPVYISALINLSVLYEDAEEFDKAVKCIDKVLEAHPNHQRAMMFKKDIESSKGMVFDEEKEKKKTWKNQLLETPITDFELSVRSRNCLRRMNVHTIGDLLRITEAELLAYKNFGETSLREIKAIVCSKGLQLGDITDESQLASYNIDGLLSVEDEAIFSKPVDDLQLSVRARKCLQKLNMKSIGEVVQHTEAELLGCKNFGVTSLNEIKKALGTFGLVLRTLDN